MSKAFREAFPTLKLEEELEGLLDTTEVTKISANHEHTHIRIYLRAKRLIFKKNIWKLEKAITEQIFQNRAIQVKIIESYELSEQYTPKSLIEVYKDSILDELNAYSVLEYNLLRTADMEFPEEDRLILTMDETIIAKTRTDEIIEFLEKVICERCGMNLKIFHNTGNRRRANTGKIPKNRSGRKWQELLRGRSWLWKENPRKRKKKRKLSKQKKKQRQLQKRQEIVQTLQKMVQIMQNQSRSLKSGESSAGNSSRITAKIHESGCNIRKRLRRREHGD